MNARETRGQRLRRLRSLEALTQAALGEAIGVSDVAISRYESDEDKPGGDVLLRLADRLGVSPSYLTCDTDDPVPRDTLSPGVRAFVDEVYGSNLSLEQFREAVRIYRAIHSKEKRED